MPRGYHRFSLSLLQTCPDETEGWADYDKMQLTMSDVTSY
jgi:hypothetical protein